MSHHHHHHHHSRHHHHGHGGAILGGLALGALAGAALASAASPPPPRPAPVVTVVQSPAPSYGYAPAPMPMYAAPQPAYGYQPSPMPAYHAPVMMAPAAPVLAHAVTPQEQWLVESCWGGKVTLRSYKGFYLRADRDDLRVVNLVDHCRTWEKWWMTDLGHNRVAFQSKFGTYLQATPSGGLCQSRARGDWEVWTRVPLPEGRFAFMSFPGKFLPFFFL